MSTLDLPVAHIAQNHCPHFLLFVDAHYALGKSLCVSPKTIFFKGWDGETYHISFVPSWFLQTFSLIIPECLQFCSLFVVHRLNINRTFIILLNLDLGNIFFLSQNHMRREKSWSEGITSNNRITADNVATFIKESLEQRGINGSARGTTRSCWRSVVGVIARARLVNIIFPKMQVCKLACQFTSSLTSCELIYKYDQGMEPFICGDNK